MSTAAPSDSQSLKHKAEASSIESQAADFTTAELSFQDEELERRTIRKLDLTILPVMTVFYLLSFLDRANIGNARVAGLQRALRLTDHQYQICVTILYVPYICTELPSNLLLRKIGPNILMPAILTFWGLAVTFQGFVSSYSGLLAVRFFLGLLEGPMFPGIVLYLSAFYTRRDLSLRIAYFFSAASLSGAFSGLLAAAISHMDGLGGKAGWSWIFILEGLFSVAFGVVSFFLVPPTPRQAKMLTEEEKEAIMRRLARDRPMFPSNEKFMWHDILRSVTSPHVLLVFILFFMGGAIFFGLALFLPSIVNQLGFTPNRSQLLSVGPFGLAFVISIIVAWASDHYNSRGIPLVLLCLMSVAGWATFLRAQDKWVAYGAFYLMVPGVYAASPLSAAWMSNNSEPYFRRATSIAFGFIATNAGGILSTWRFPTKEGPRFRKTTIMNLTFACIMAIGAALNIVFLSWMNARKRRLREKILAPYVTEKDPTGGTKAWIELGDQHPDFKYTL